MTEPLPSDRHLSKSLRWFDGFVLALATISALMAVVGHSILRLGAMGASLLWGISISVAMLQNFIYSEMAAMFPARTGGIPMYAHEGWRRYSPLVGPIANFGYWFSWATVPALFGLSAGTMLQEALGVTGDLHVGPVSITFPRLVAACALIALWGLNLMGARPSVRVSYVLAVLLVVPTLAIILLPYATGAVRAARLTLDPPGVQGFLGGPRVVLTWLYIMGWSSYASEVSAAFAPEYRDTVRDTPRALRASAAFGLTVFILLPLGIGEILAPGTIAASPASAPVLALQTLFGKGSGYALMFLIAGFALGMNSAMLDSSRALYAMAEEGLTIKQPFRLSRRQVPAPALTIGLALDLVLVFYVHSVIGILAVGNFCYFLVHIAALTGFLLLRRDRPTAPRPIELPRVFLFIAVLLTIADGAFLVVGSLSFGITGYGGARELLLAVLVVVLGLGLFLVRRLLQDRSVKA